MLLSVLIMKLSAKCKTYAENFSKILIFGDFNSRTKTLRDFIEIDEYIFSSNDAEDLVEESNGELSYFTDDRNNARLDRTNSDKGVNNYGYKLIDFCKNNSMYILNGRTGSDQYVGKVTCKNVSTVDYFISSPNIVPRMKEFYINEFSDIISDAHCLITLELCVHLLRKIQSHRMNPLNVSDFGIPVVLILLLVILTKMKLTS